MDLHETTNSDPEAHPVYEATARREGRWWVITVPELDTTARASRVAEIKAIAADLVTAQPGAREATVRVKIEVPEIEAWHEAAALQATAEAAQRAAVSLRKDVIHHLLTEEEGLTAEDVGQLLGISRQRVQQLTSPSIIPGPSPQQLITDLLETGWTIGGIATELNRSPRTVIKVLNGHSNGLTYRTTLLRLADPLALPKSLGPRRRAKRAQ